MQQGDKVTIGSGMFSGKEGEIVEIDQASGLATVDVEAFGQSRETRVPVGDLEAVTDDPEELRETIRAKIREAVEAPFEVRRNLWWARKAVDGAPADRELLEDFRAHRDELVEERQQAVERALRDVREEIDGMDVGELRAWMAQHRQALQQQPREEIAELERTFLDESVPEGQLQALKDETLADEAGDSELMDDEAARQRAVDRLVSALVDEGMDLWERARDAAALDDHDGFAWERISPGPVDLDVDPPEDEVAEAEPATGASIPTVPEELEGAGDPQTWYRALEEASAFFGVDAPARHGLATRSGVTEDFADNPWGITMYSGLGDLVDTVWGPLESRAPNVIAGLRDRCLAAGLFYEKGDGDGEPYLVYLMGHADGEPTALVGTPPDETMTVEFSYGTFDLPMSFRELRARHGSLATDTHVIGASIASVADLVRGDAQRFEAANAGVKPRRYVAFATGEDDERIVFDRDELDERNDPRIAHWNPESLEVGYARVFWKAMDALVVEMIE